MHSNSTKSILTWQTATLYIVLANLLTYFVLDVFYRAYKETTDFGPTPIVHKQTEIDITTFLLINLLIGNL